MLLKLSLYCRTQMVLLSLLNGGPGLPHPALSVYLLKTDSHVVQVGPELKK